MNECEEQDIKNFPLFNDKDADCYTFTIKSESISSTSDIDANNENMNWKGLVQVKEEMDEIINVNTDLCTEGKDETEYNDCGSFNVFSDRTFDTNNIHKNTEAINGGDSAFKIYSSDKDLTGTEVCLVNSNITLHDSGQILNTLAMDLVENNDVGK